MGGMGGGCGGGGGGMGKGAPVDISDLQIAVLKMTVPEKGHSFLTQNPADESSRIYVHESVASPLALEQCQAVAFKPHISAKGSLQASAPVRLLMGRAEADKPVEWGEFMGRIIKVSALGDGFVECPEAEAKFGKQTYIFRKVMALCQIFEGDEISFNVHVNDRGMPQVPSPIWKQNNEGKGGAVKSKGFGKGFKDAMNGMDMGKSLGGMGAGMGGGMGGGMAGGMAG